MKARRWLLAVLIVVLVFSGVAFGFSLQKDASVDYNEFRPRLHAVLIGTGLRVQELRSCSEETITTPLWIRWHPCRWYPRTPSTAPYGFSPASERENYERYTLGLGETTAVYCFVAEFEGRARYIVVAAQPETETTGRALRAALSREFPGIPVAFRIKAA